MTRQGWSQKMRSSWQPHPVLAFGRSRPRVRAFPPQRFDNRKQFTCAVSTGVSLVDCLQTIGDEVLRKIPVGEDASNDIGHGGLGICRQIAFARKETLVVRPRRAGERNTASQGLEHADSGNAGKCSCVWPARHMHRHARPREGLRRAMIREPACVVDSTRGQHVTHMSWVAHAVDSSAQSKTCCRIDQKYFELAAALLVAPIADPDQIGVRLFRWLWPKQVGISCFVPSEGALRPAAAQIDFAQYL